MKTLKRLLAVLCILGGVALSVYAAWSLIELPDLALGKFSSEARDTATGILFLLLGGVIALAGLGNLDLSSDKPLQSSVSDCGSSPPEA